MVSILLSKNAKVSKGGVVFKLMLYCFKIDFLLELYYFLNGVRFYSRVGLHLRGYGRYFIIEIKPFHQLKLLLFAGPRLFAVTEVIFVNGISLSTPTTRNFKNPSSL